MRIVAIVLSVLVFGQPLWAGNAQAVPPGVQRYMESVQWASQDFPGKSFNTLRLDYPYQDFRDPKDYFSMNVMKAYGEERPVLFVITLGQLVDPNRGLSLHFFHRRSDGKFEPLDRAYAVTPDEVHEQFVVFVFPKMKSKKVDLFRHFMDGDVVIADFFDKDGAEHKVMMAYPSHIFRAAYERLK